MIDKIILINNKQAYIYYINKAPISIYSSTGEVLKLLDELLCPFNSIGITSKTQWDKSYSASLEDTQEIELNKIS